MTEIRCNLNGMQYNAVFFVEGALWAFSIFAMAVMAQLTTITEALLTVSGSSVTLLM